MTGAGLLRLHDVAVSFGDVRVVDGVGYEVRAGEVVAVVGESGSGKTVTAMSLLGLLPPTARVTGRAELAGRDLHAMTAAELRAVRGGDVGMVFQEPMSALNPVFTIGDQLVEAIRAHQDVTAAAARERAVELFGLVGLPNPRERFRSYPHELSGGQLQRVVIAMAVANEPKLLIADEPTTALDVTIQAQILALLRELVQDTGTALIMITHDLGVVAGLCDEVNVLYGGKIVERAQRHQLFAEPRHPYTHGLLASIPRLDAGRGEKLIPIRGSVADNIPWDHGCAFAPRCPNAVQACREVQPQLVPDHGGLLRCHNPVRPAVAAGGGTR